MTPPTPPLKKLFKEDTTEEASKLFQEKAKHLSWQTKAMWWKNFLSW
jgi:hypothetical protein